jgi:uncharacterized protein (DUF427 family)
MQAVWNGQVIAESDETIKLEGRHYFPRRSLDPKFFSNSRATTVCPWKGKANYLNVTVDGKVNEGAAWTYKRPKSAAKEITGHVAFWKGVKVKSTAERVGAMARVRGMFGS